MYPKETVATQLPIDVVHPFGRRPDPAAVGDEPDHVAIGLGEPNLNRVEQKNGVI